MEQPSIKWYEGVREYEPKQKSVWAKRNNIDKSLPLIEIRRGSCSRPWQLENSTPTLFDSIDYPGPIRQILFESIVEGRGSKRCIRYGINSGHFDRVIEIKPSYGQGFSLDLCVTKVIEAPYMLQWDDDFKAAQDIPLHDCIDIMKKHKDVNQIAFNKRETAESRENENLPGGKIVVTFQAVERSFEVDDEKTLFLTSMDKWKFGVSLWRMSFVKKHWQYHHDAIHNRFNTDLVKLMLPNWGGTSWPSDKIDTEMIQKHIGCYWWGRIGTHRMVEHTGKDDSLWTGKMQKQWQSGDVKFKDIA